MLSLDSGKGLPLLQVGILITDHEPGENNNEQAHNPCIKLGADKHQGGKSTARNRYGQPRMTAVTGRYDIVSGEPKSAAYRKQGGDDQAESIDLVKGSNVQDHGRCGSEGNEFGQGTEFFPEFIGTLEPMRSITAHAVNQRRQEDKQYSVTGLSFKNLNHRQHSSAKAA